MRTISMALLMVSLLMLGVASCGEEANDAESTVIPEPRDSRVARMTPDNETCPVDTGKSVSADSPIVEWEGYTIGFCCKDCVGEWESWPADKKEQFVSTLDVDAHDDGG